MGTKCNQNWKCWKFYCSVIQGLMQICLAYWFCLYAKSSPSVLPVKHRPGRTPGCRAGMKQLLTTMWGEAGTTLTQLSKPIQMVGEMSLCNWILCQSELYPLGFMLVRLHAWPNYCNLLLPVKQQIAIKLEIETISSSHSSRTNS
jgi:hypothetical protein